MAFPIKSSLRIDQKLTNISLAYTNENYVWDKVMPTLRVPKTTGKIAVYNNDQLRVPDGRRSNKDVDPHIVEWSLGTDLTYQIEYYDHDELVTDQEYNEYEQPFDAQVDAIWTLNTFKQQRLESNIAAIMNDPLELTNTSTPSTLWDVSTSDPLGDMETAMMAVKAKIGRRPNYILTNDHVISALSKHPDFLNRINGVKTTFDKGDVVKIIASYLGIKENNILVGSAIKETTIEGQTSSLGDIWADDFVVYYRPETPTRRAPTFGFNMMLSKNKKKEGIYKYRYHTDLADGFRIAYNNQFKVLDADAAYLLDQVIT